MSLESKAQEEKVQDAFQDLDALMVRAGEMVRIGSSPIVLSSTTESDRRLYRSNSFKLSTPV